MSRITSSVVISIVLACWAATMAHAQGTPPFPISNPGTSAQSVVITPSAYQDDGTTDIDIRPSTYAGESRGQTSTYAKTGRLWTIPGSVAFALPGGLSSAPLPNDAGSRSFLVFENPVVVPGPTAPFRFLGDHFFDAQCPSSTCGYLAGGLGPGNPIRSESESSFNLPSGNVAARAEAGTPDYGRRFFDDGPFTDKLYNHVIDASSSASLADWVYVTGPGSTATLVVQASLAASISTPPVPVNAADWTTPVYGDIRTFDRCSDANLTGDKLLRPIGLRRTEFDVALGISAGYQFLGGQWVPSIVGGSGLQVQRGADLHWADEEGLPDCGDDFAEVTASSVGSLAPSISLQRVVPTNQWARVSISTSAHSRCEGPFNCALNVSAPAHLSISSPNGSLVAWQGIAGLTPVPEPSSGLLVGVPLLAQLATRRRARKPDARRAEIHESARLGCRRRHPLDDL